MIAFLDRMTDFLNPILVKEVRQGLRGRYFKGSYALTLFIATLVGLTVLVIAGQGSGGDIGQIFFAAIYVCLCGAVLALIPFQAFISSATADPRQADLLALSNLRPRQIVWGRLLATLVQGSLIVSALFPFLGLAYLLPGVDLGAALVAVLTALCYGSVMACVTIAASWLTSNKLLRVLIMAACGIFQLNITFTACALGIAMLEDPAVLQDREFYWALAAFWLHGLAIGGFALVGAASRIGHPEENRSTMARVLTTLIVLAGTALPYLLYAFSPARDDEIQLATTAYTLFFVSMPVALFVTEPEHFGRRVRLQVPKNRVLALLITPWMPGGANGLLLAVILGGIAVFPLILVPAFSVDYGHHLRATLLLVWAYWVITMSWPSWPLSRWSTRLPLRVLSFFFIPGFSFLGMTGPVFLGFLSNQSDWEGGQHSLNPIWGMEEVWRARHEAAEVCAVVFSLALAGLLVNLPRIYRAASRTLECSEEKRRRAKPGS